MRQATRLLLFCCCSVLLSSCLAESFFISPYGTNGDSCLEDDPCGSIEDVLRVFGNATSDLDIYLAPGFYSGSQNIEITFPNVTTSLLGQNEVYFACTEGSTFAFSSSNHFTLSGGISITGCEATVISNEGNLNLENIFIQNTNRGIQFTGENLCLHSVTVEHAEIILSISNISKSIEISSSHFQDSYIAIEGQAGDESALQIQISNSTFQSISQGISFDIGTQSYGKIDNCTFVGNANGIAMYLSGGHWNLTHLHMEDYYAGIEATNTISLDVSYCSIISEQNGSNIGIETDQIDLSVRQCYIDCIFGISFSGEEYGSLFISNSSISTLAVQSCSEFQLDNIFIHSASSSTFRNSSGSITQSNFQATRKFDVASYRTQLSMEDGSNITISDCLFEGCRSGYNGGALRFLASKGIIVNTIFYNCGGSQGGAIYTSGTNILRVDNSSFISNIAQSGGAIFIGPESSYPEDFRFTNNTFINNTAGNGAAIACCSDYDCFTEIHESGNFFEGNQNLVVGGEDIACSYVNGEDTVNLFLSSRGNDTTTCSQTSPCGNLRSVFEVFGNSTEPLQVIIRAGFYTGLENSNLTIPSTNVSLVASSGIVKFQCAEEALFGFFSSSSLEIIGEFKILSCPTAIGFQGNSLTLLNVGIDGGNIGIDFIGENLLISCTHEESRIIPCGMANMETGIRIRKISTLSMNRADIKRCNVFGLDLEYSGLIRSVDISLTVFSSGSGIRFITDSNALVNARISDCSFDEITSLFACELEHGMWELKRVYFLGCVGAISYTGSGSFGFLYISESCTITSGQQGIFFDSEAELLVSNTNFDKLDSGLVVNDVNRFTIISSLFTLVGTPIQISIPTRHVLYSIQDIRFLLSGTSRIEVSMESSGYIEGAFSYGGEGNGLLSLSGGNWNFESFSSISDSFSSVPLALLEGSFVVKGFFNNLSAGSLGGAIYCKGSEKLVVKDSQFYNCTASVGGAIYATDFGALEIINTEFNLCTSATYGGALELEGTTADVEILDSSFIHNEATSGAAVSCCSSTLNNTICSISLYERSVSYEDNINRKVSGDDVLCPIGVLMISSIEEPSTSASISTVMMARMIVLLTLFMLLLLTLAVITIVYIYIKRKRRTNIEIPILQ